MKEVYRISFCVLFLTAFYVVGLGQSCNIPINSRSTFIVDRLLAKYDMSSDIHPVLKPYQRDEVVDYVYKLYLSDIQLSHTDLEDIKYILRDNNDIFRSKVLPVDSTDAGVVYLDSSKVFYTYHEERTDVEGINLNDRRSPVLKYFFKSQANFLELNHKDFSLRINPLLNIKFGDDIKESTGVIFQNTRGLEIKGRIDNKVYFYTNLIENQGTFNNYIIDRINAYRAIPGFGSYKPFNSRLSDNLQGYDFPNSQAYFGLNISRHVGLELGHGKHFIGNGYNSLLLSDYAHNYFYLKLSTNIWKFHYQNIFAELAPISSNLFLLDELLPKKYKASHFLNFKATSNFEIGIFESVVFSRPDHFEFQYLNPIIFYRSVEFFLNSPDNVLLGLNTNWKPFKNANVYGQVIIDEFSLNELRDGSGWWANKYGFQLGIKYYDFVVDDLSIQAEVNVVRPYTYDHRDTLAGFDISVANYSHFNQALAHPLGANFKEFLFKVDYQPIQNLSISSVVTMANYGEDTDGQNWGGDILKPYQIGKELTIPSEYDNTIGQGTSTDIFQWKLDLSYEFFHNYNLDFHYLYRKKDSEDDAFDINTNYIGAGIRANISNLKIDY